MTPELWASWRRPSQDEMMASRYHKAAIEALVPLLAAHRPVLCVGCGDGTELGYFPGSIGVTLNAGGLLPVCRQRHEIVVADMHCLPFRNGAFSAIFCKDTFEHALAPWIALNELTRVARDCILLATPDESWEHSPHHPLIPTVRQINAMAQKLSWQTETWSLTCTDPTTYCSWDLRILRLTRGTHANR